VTTNAVRAAILVGAVVVGAIVIANAFPTSGAPGITPVSSPSSSPSSHPSTHPTPPHKKLDCSKAQGTQLAVENATSTAGLAAATATRLVAAGYRIDTSPNSKDIGNAPTQSSTTTVYYRTSTDKTAARCLRKKYFQGAGLQQLPSTSSVSSGVQVAIFLGQDYAAKHPVH
jgi:hypothetical protein